MLTSEAGTPALFNGVDGRPRLGVAVIDSAYGFHVVSFLCGLLLRLW